MKVYVVIEVGTGVPGAVVHGVYSSAEAASKKAVSIKPAEGDIVGFREAEFEE